MRTESRSGCYSPALPHRVVTCRPKVGMGLQPCPQGRRQLGRGGGDENVGHRWTGTHSPGRGYGGTLQARTLLRMRMDHDVSMRKSQSLVPTVIPSQTCGGVHFPLLCPDPSPPGLATDQQPLGHSIALFLAIRPLAPLQLQYRHTALTKIEDWNGSCSWYVWFITHAHGVLSRMAQARESVTDTQRQSTCSRTISF